MDIKERLDNLRIRIQQPDFLNNLGLGNEVGIWIFSYKPEEEMLVRDFTEKLVTCQNLDCHVVEKNLYSILMELCGELDITDAIPEMETEDGKDFLLEQLYSAIGVDSYVEKIYFEPQISGKDVLLITGVGDVFPFMRVHVLLQALRLKFPEIPILVMYPGKFDGNQLSLFHRLKPNPCYRPFNIIDGGEE